ncbi:uncharacterized protein LOC127010680 [Drosophila biarmipes]|uniref:uncharacterized protein LOC127010680 n=1 Tax=Drosophila biarmipes TaxID=125945 RepID=UPI0021CCB8E8|nr:uncharacterized protein LOC127010680 [Drosophila biarmipes]
MGGAVGPVESASKMFNGRIRKELLSQKCPGRMWSGISQFEEFTVLALVMNRLYHNDRVEPYKIYSRSIALRWVSKGSKYAWRWSVRETEFRTLITTQWADS